MDDFQRYLDMFSPGDAALRAALDGRLAPSAHYERFFNVSFPRPWTGLGDLGEVGQPLENPQARIVGDRGELVPDTTWLQRALNTLLPVAQRIAVDGNPGPQTLRAAQNAWSVWSGLPGAEAARALAVRQDPASRFAVPRLTPTGIAIERAFLNFLIGRVQVADPPRVTVTPGPVELDPPPADPLLPTPSNGTGTGALALVAVAALLGFWYSR